ncbi:FecCD family ABC transporter permease [Paenibacillus antibioticophila]|uniref:FecCD family ABC transporter permease n=1 Tax=Paenibacillus antibioticophila TaxID=1274374 RepID=UPI0005C7F4CD|nr:iron ABC transporter permease [Paenibacillus antibioticophila]
MLQRRRVAIATIIGMAGLIAILVSIVLSVILGYADIKLQVIWDALFHFDPANREHLVIQTIRLPRVFAAGIVGTCFAVTGAMMQGMTRNPLADSSLLGINAGAGLVLALSFAYLTNVSYNFILLLSIFGAAVGAALIYGIGFAGKNNSSSLRLVLAGAAVTALFNGLNEGLSLYFGIGQNIAFWYASGVSRVTWSQIVYVTPWFVAGLVCALVLSRSVTILSIGEDNARSLGLKIGQLKLVIAVVVLVLAGISVALVGGVGFVGLIVPHLVRKLVGQDYRLVIPCSAVLGALLVILADLFARTMNPPFEIPLSAVTAALGVPFFLYLVRKGGRMER